MSRNFIDSLAAVTRYAASLDRFLSQRYTNDHLSKAADPYGTGTLRRFKLGQATAVYSGRIVASIAGIHCYRVLPDGLKRPIVCSCLSSGSVGPYGARPTSQLPPGSQVYYLKGPSSFVGTIIGAEPAPGVDPRVILAGYLHLSSRCGVTVDAAHSALFKLGGSVNYSGGRPIDGLPGDAGFMAETGVGIHVDSFMASLSADEETGVWAFLEDGLLRVSGHHLQIRSSGGSIEGYDDEGEYTLITGVTPYPTWEGLGGLRPGVTCVKAVPAEQYQIEAQEFGPVEPLNHDQVPFERLIEYAGYLGNLHTRMVVAPPSGGQFWRLSGTTPAHGLFVENIGMDGAYSVQSARGISLRVSPFIVAPKRIRAMEHREGDGPSSYRAAGIFGTGVNHAYLASPRSSHAVIPINSGEDRDAYRRWTSRRVFSLHTKDYLVADETSSVIPEGFSVLAGQQYLEAPPVRQVQVDHRLGEVEVSQVSAGVEVLPDGNVLIQGAGGETIKAVNGSLELECPGDIRLNPGRSLVIFAGRDLICRAKNSMDLSTTDKDIRIRAGSQLHIQADDGGVFIESNSVGDHMDFDRVVGEEVRSTGVTLKATNSPVRMYGQSVYMRSLDSGRITLDADRGKGSVDLIAQSFIRFIENESTDNFGSEIDGVWVTTSVTRWGTYTAFIGAANLGIDGTIAVNGSVMVQDSVLVVDGTVATTMGGDMSVLDEGKPAAELSMSALVDQVKLQSEQKSESDFDAIFAIPLYAANRSGNDDLIDVMQFSFRSTDQYKANDWVHYEALWQRYARTKGEGTRWYERKAMGGGEESYPFPGRERLVEAKALRIMDPTLSDPATGQVLPDDDAMKAAEYPEPVEKTMDGEYLVIA